MNVVLTSPDQPASFTSNNDEEQDTEKQVRVEDCDIDTATPRLETVSERAAKQQTEVTPLLEHLASLTLTF